MATEIDPGMLKIAEALVRRGQPLTLDELARKAGVSRSTAHRRTGGRRALVKALESRGVSPEIPTTRARLLEAARAVVATRGLIGASVESLAAEAGVGPVSVYRTFGDRDSLLREALADVFPSAAFIALADRQASLESVLEQVAVAVIHFAVAYPGLMAMILAPASAERAELMMVHGQQSDLRGEIVALLRRSMAVGAISPGSAGDYAGAFLGLCLGTSLLQVGLQPLGEVEVPASARRVVRRFLALVAL